VPFLPETKGDVNLKLSNSLAYKVTLSDGGLGFKILRRDGTIMYVFLTSINILASATVITFCDFSFDSIGVGGFVFSDQFLQISTLLPTHYIYGLGEHNGPLLKNTNWKQFTMWNADNAPSKTVR
jgi:hypothetical protein